MYRWLDIACTQNPGSSLPDSNGFTRKKLDCQKAELMIWAKKLDILLQVQANLKVI